MSIKPAKIYPFTLPAFGSLPLLVQGSYWKVLSATGDLEITGDTFGTLDTIQPGQGLKGQEFSRLVVRDKSGAMNAVRLLVADEDFVDDRVTGEVLVIDGNKRRTESGRAFVATMQVGIPSAGLIHQMAVMNPSGSGVNLVVNNIISGVTQSGPVHIVGGVGVPVGVIQSVFKKDISTGISQGQAVKYDAVSMAPGSMGGSVLVALAVQGGQSFVFPLQEPFIVREGCYIAVRTTTDQQSLAASVQFYEEKSL